MSVDAFKQLLYSKGIEIKSGSELEYDCQVLKEIYYQHLKFKSGDATSVWPKFRDDLQRSIGALNLIQLILSQAEHPNFDVLVPHLRLLSNGAISQTKSAPSTDSISNKIFELRLALSCLRIGSELSLDDPIKSSGGKNPDIMCRLRDNKIWGFACKVIHGDAPMSFFHLFESGVAQIEKSQAEIGLVIVSMKNRIPHEEIFPELGQTNGEGVILGAHPKWESVRMIISSLFQQRVDDMVKHVGNGQIANMLRGKKALPAIACPLEAVIGIATDRGPVPTILSYLHTIRMDWGVAKRLDKSAEQILRDLNAGLAVGRPS